MIEVNLILTQFKSDKWTKVWGHGTYQGELVVFWGTLKSINWAKYPRISIPHAVEYKLRKGYVESQIALNFTNMKFKPKSG